MEKQKYLEQFFLRFPGIGPRQAKRFVYHLINQSDSYIRDFINSISEMKKSSHRCESCQRLYIDEHNTKMQSKRCGICSSQNRDITSLMILSKESDLENVEKSGAYKGLYFVIGGMIPLMETEYDKYIRLSRLIHRIKTDQNIHEIIISLSLNREGENTASVLRDEIKKINTSIRIYELGRGLSTGSEIEYADTSTIESALKNKI